MPVISYTTNDKFNQPEKARALCSCLGAHWVDIEECAYADDIFQAGEGEYWVLTENGAEHAEDLALDECYSQAISGVPDELQGYLDKSSWISDAKIDTRGSSLASYDGDELDGTDPVTKNTFFIYRIS